MTTNVPCYVVEHLRSLTLHFNKKFFKLSMIKSFSFNGADNLNHQFHYFANFFCMPIVLFVPTVEKVTEYYRVFFHALDYSICNTSRVWPLNDNNAKSSLESVDEINGTKSETCAASFISQDSSTAIDNAETKLRPSTCWLVIFGDTLTIFHCFSRYWCLFNFFLEYLLCSYNAEISLQMHL